MKKIILLIVFFSFLCSARSIANPVAPTPVISELYFNNNQWFIELMFDYTTGIYVSDSLVLITSTDTVSFKSFEITEGVLFVITVDSLLSPLIINKNGDIVEIGFRYNSDIYLFDYFPIIFGNIQNALVSAPSAGQSIKTYRCYDFSSGEYHYYVVKDNNPSIGSDPYNAEAGSSFSGYVYDTNHIPLANVYFNSYYNAAIMLNCSPPYPSLYSDANGYFHCQNLFSYFRHLYLQKQFCISIDTIFSIEPDSDYFMEFTFDSCYVGMNEFTNTSNTSMQVFPNPGQGDFTFNITLPDLIGKNCTIIIYNASGEIVNIIPINSTISSVTEHWNGRGKYDDLPAGLYSCSLEADGNIITSQKLIIEK